MARVQRIGSDKAGNTRKRYVAIPQVSKQHDALQTALEDAAKTGKPVTLAPEKIKEMLALLTQGATHISYERFPSKEDGSVDFEKPFPEPLYGMVYLGSPEAEGVVIVSNKAIRGGNSANAVIEDVERNGRKYSNTVGVKFSSWVTKQDAEDYKKSLAADGFKVGAAKPTADIPTGTAKPAAGGQEIPFHG